jgi:hypothetical protein
MDMLKQTEYILGGILCESSVLVKRIDRDNNNRSPKITQEIFIFPLDLFPFPPIIGRNTYTNEHITFSLHYCRPSCGPYY